MLEMMDFIRIIYPLFQFKARGDLANDCRLLDYDKEIYF